MLSTSVVDPGIQNTLYVNHIFCQNFWKKREIEKKIGPAGWRMDALTASLNPPMNMTQVLAFHSRFLKSRPLSLNGNILVVLLLDKKPNQNFWVLHVVITGNKTLDPWTPSSCIFNLCLLMNFFPHIVHTHSRLAWVFLCAATREEPEMKHEIEYVFIKWIIIICLVYVAMNFTFFHVGLETHR